MLKIGIDVHGVLDTFPEIVKLIDTLQFVDGIEIHIITGLTYDDAVTQVGHLVDLTKVHYFSIVEGLVAHGFKVEWRDGLPYADSHAWNRAKAIYCKEQDIDFMFDDSPTYGEYFDSPDIRTVFCQVRNPKRTIYTTR